MHEYQSSLEEVVDGDTVDVTVDLGFNLRRKIRLRIKGIDTAEIFGVDHDSSKYDRGMEHKGFVIQWFQFAQENYNGDYPLIISTDKKGKFGRYLASVERKVDGSVLEDDLQAEYDGIDY